MGDILERAERAWRGALSGVQIQPGRTPIYESAARNSERG